MNDLEIYFRNNKQHLIHRFIHHLDIYDSFLNKYRGQEINILEIGCGWGGSLLMWKEYFGIKAKIYGVDKLDRHMLDDAQIKTFEGIFGNKEFIQCVKSELPSLDVIIDDGSHECADQIMFLHEFFPKLKDEGLYFCEDVQTSYSEAYGGGYKNPKSYLEHIKNLVDYLHGEFGEDIDPCVNFKSQIYSIQFFQFLVGIEKNISKVREIRSPEKTGVQDA